MILLGEVSLLTENVPRLADFYKALLGVENGSDDPVHQFILTEGAALTIYNDGVHREQNLQNIQLAFTVDDVDAELDRVKALGAQIVTPPKAQPWGAKNMSFLDPDGNLIYFRSFPKKS